METLRVLYDREERRLPSELHGDSPDTLIMEPALELHLEHSIVVYRQCFLVHSQKGTRPYGLIIGTRVGEREEERSPDGQIHFSANVATIPMRDRPLYENLLFRYLRGPINFS